jgi:GTP:adenosylcobinamide-phosphate guanylyltransferase
MDCSVIITANGEGNRMKSISTLPKFMLNYKGKSIIQHLIEQCSPTHILTHYNILTDNVIHIEKTTSRKETIEHIKHLNNVYIVDADIVFNEDFSPNIYLTDILFTCNGRNAGIYFVKSISTLLDKMIGDDIVSGMVNFKSIEFKTVHLGTPDEYYKAIGI